MTRLYLPATLRLLAVLDDDGSLSVGDDVVVVEHESEDEEYDALMTAAETAAVLAAEMEPGERRRVVVVAEVAQAGAPARISRSEVVAVHADPDEQAGPDDDLAWYATQEIPALLNRN